MMMIVIIIMLKNVAAQIGPRTRTHTLFGPAQSKRMSRFLQEPLYAQVKCRRPKPRRRLCASLRSRNGHQHVRRATLHGNLQGKGRRTEFRPAIFSLGVRKRRKPFLEVSQIAQLGSPDSQPTPRRRSRYDPPRVQEGGPEKGNFPPKVVFVVVSKYFPISHILDDHHAPHLLSEFSRVDADSSSCTLHVS